MSYFHLLCPLSLVTSAYCAFILSVVAKETMGPSFGSNIQLKKLHNWRIRVGSYFLCQAALKIGAR